METVPIEALEERLDKLARRVESGEVVVVTRDGRPVLYLVPHGAGAAEGPGIESTAATSPKIGLDFEAGRRFLAARGIDRLVTYIAPDFDDQLPEDFLLRPLPEFQSPPEEK